MDTFVVSLQFPGSREKLWCGILLRLWHRRTKLLEIQSLAFGEQLPFVGLNTRLRPLVLDLSPERAQSGYDEQRQIEFLRPAHRLARQLVWRSDVVHAHGTART